MPTSLSSSEIPFFRTKVSGAAQQEEQRQQRQQQQQQHQWRRGCSAAAEKQRRVRKQFMVYLMEKKNGRQTKTNVQRFQNLPGIGRLQTWFE